MGTMRKASPGSGGGDSSSVLFSLGELMKIEEQRVDEEHRRSEDARVAAEMARIEAEARARREQEARLAAERSRQEAKLRAAREEGARLEAMRAAAIERARVEAEERARLQAMTAAQEHEKGLIALREDAQKKSLSRWLVGTIVGAVLLGGSGLGIYFGSVRPEAEARERAAAVELEQAREELARTRKELTAREEAVATLQKEREAATDARARAELDAKIAAEEKKITELRGRGTGRLPNRDDKPPPPPVKCVGDPNDPMNGCL
jgi:colicin import membrane protein